MVSIGYSSCWLANFNNLLNLRHSFRLNGMKKIRFLMRLALSFYPFVCHCVHRASEIYTFWALEEKLSSHFKFLILHTLHVNVLAHENYPNAFCMLSSTENLINTLIPIEHRIVQMRSIKRNSFTHFYCCCLFLCWNKKTEFWMRMRIWNGKLKWSEIK